MWVFLFLFLRFIVSLCIDIQSRVYIRIQCRRQPTSEEVVLNLVSGACWCSDGELPATRGPGWRCGESAGRSCSKHLQQSIPLGVADHEGGSNFPVARVCLPQWSHACS